MGVAILLLIAEVLVLGRRNPLLRGVKLFELSDKESNSTNNKN